MDFWELRDMAFREAIEKKFKNLYICKKWITFNKVKKLGCCNVYCFARWPHIHNMHKNGDNRFCGEGEIDCARLRLNKRGVAEYFCHKNEVYVEKK